MADSLRLVSGGDDIKIWELPELRLLHTFKPHSNAVSSLSWSPNSILVFYKYDRLRSYRNYLLILFKFISHFVIVNCLIICVYVLKSYGEKSLIYYNFFVI